LIYNRNNNKKKKEADNVNTSPKESEDQTKNNKTEKNQEEKATNSKSDKTWGFKDLIYRSKNKVKADEIPKPKEDTISNENKNLDSDESLKADKYQENAEKKVEIIVLDKTQNRSSNELKLPEADSVKASKLDEKDGAIEKKDEHKTSAFYKAYESLTSRFSKGETKHAEEKIEKIKLEISEPILNSNPEISIESDTIKEETSEHFEKLEPNSSNTVKIEKSAWYFKKPKPLNKYKISHEDVVLISSNSKLDINSNSLEDSSLTISHNDLNEPALNKKAHKKLHKRNSSLDDSNKGMFTKYNSPKSKSIDQSNSPSLAISSK
jgi:hypothetical protein